MLNPLRRLFKFAKVLLSDSIMTSLSERGLLLTVKSPISMASTTLTCSRMPSIILLKSLASWPISSSLSTSTETSTFPFAISLVALTSFSIWPAIMLSKFLTKNNSQNTEKTINAPPAVYAAIAAFFDLSMAVFA